MIKSIVNYPFTDDKTVNLLQITDPHLFADPDSKLLGVNTHQSFQAVLESVLTHQEQQDFCIVSGDISQDYSPTSYRNFTEQVKQLNLPCHFLPGNHDDPHLMSLHMQGKHMHGQPRVIAGNWLIILLNSTVYGKPGGYMAESQFTLIDEAIKANPEKHVLLVMHHNPILTQCTWLDQHCMANGDEFLARVSEYPQVKGLLWGHVHQQVDTTYAGKYNDIALMATPSTCIQFKPRSTHFALDGVQPGYRLLQLASDGSICSQVYRVAGQRFTPDVEASGY